MPILQLETSHEWRPGNSESSSHAHISSFIVDPITQQKIEIADTSMALSMRFAIFVVHLFSNFVFFSHERSKLTILVDTSS